MQKIAVILFLITLFSRDILAQKSGDTTVQLNGIEVVSPRPLREKGVFISKIDSAELREALTESMAELLSTHSPIFIKTYGQGSLATASFRGTAASHTQVQWNGININSPMTGQVDFSQIPIYFVDEISLFHGGSSLQEGSGALGGSVLFGAEPNWDKKFYGSIIQTVGSFSSYQTFATIGGGNKKIQFRVRYNYETSKNDFEFENSSIEPDQDGNWQIMRQKNGDYFKNGVLGEIYWNIDNKNLISINGWLQNSDRNLPPIISYQGGKREETQKDNETRISAKWDRYWNKISSNYTFGFTKTELDYYLGNFTNLGLFTNIDSRSSIRSFYNNYNLKYNASKWLNIEAKANYNKHKVDILDHKNGEGYQALRDEIGLSVNSYVQIYKWFSAFALLREELVDKKSSPLMYTVGIELLKEKNRNQFLFRTNFSRNYHQPSLNDLYWLPGGNIDLLPEEGNSLDIGLSHSFKNKNSLFIDNSIDGFASLINNWIIWQPSEYRYWTAQNIKKVFSRGVEYKLSINKIWENISLKIIGNYSYTHTTNETNSANNDQSLGKQLIYIPINKANLLLGTQYKKYYFSYNFSYIDERFTTTSNEDLRHTLPAYSLSNISVGKMIELKYFKCNFQFKIDNLFNLSYQSILSRPMPGINYSFMLKISF